MNITDPFYFEHVIICYYDIMTSYFMVINEFCMVWTVVATCTSVYACSESSLRDGKLIGQIQEVGGVIECELERFFYVVISNNHRL